MYEIRYMVYIQHHNKKNILNHRQNSFFYRQINYLIIYKITKMLKHTRRKISFSANAAYYWNLQGYRFY